MISKSTKPSVQSFVNAEEYYEVHKCVSSTFQVLQVGLCTFKLVSGSGLEKQYQTDREKYMIIYYYF